MRSFCGRDIGKKAGVSRRPFRIGANGSIVLDTFTNEFEFGFNAASRCNRILKGPLLLLARFPKAGPASVKRRALAT